LSLVFVIGLSATTLSGCCTTKVPVLKPPPCPEWSDNASVDLEMLIQMQEVGEIDIVDLEYQLGQNHRHCEALDGFLTTE